jgi:ABC-type amino acid transport system permease subunit
VSSTTRSIASPASASRPDLETEDVRKASRRFHPRRRLGARHDGNARSSARVPRAAAATYVEGMRNIPLLVHMYFWYAGLAFLRLPPFACGVFALALYSGAYVAEIVRSGIGAVPRGQWNAALATGLTPLQAFRYIIYPQALRIVLPSLAGIFSQLVKDSSLASVITVAELTYQATAIEGQTFRTFEIYITISLLYLALVSIITYGLLLVPGARDAAAQGLSDA